MNDTKHSDTKLFCGCEDCDPSWMQFYRPNNPFLKAKDQDYNQHYYVTQDGHAITEPMTAADIVAKFGAIRELEANGFKVVPC